MSTKPKVRVRRTKLKRGVALEVLTLTPKDIDEFAELHARGAQMWGQRWLKINQWVKLGAEIGIRQPSGVEPLRLMLSHIAFRLCLQLYGKPKDILDG